MKTKNQFLIIAILCGVLFSISHAFSQNKNNNNSIINFLNGEWYLQKATYHYIDNEFFQYNLNNNNNNIGYNEIDYQVLIDPIYIKFDINNKNEIIISNIKHNIQTLLFEIDKENILYIGSELYYQIHIKGKNKIELKYIDESVILNLEYQRK